jgi:hypothetical protein
MRRVPRRFHFGRLQGAAAGAVVGAVIGVLAALIADRLLGGPQSGWWIPAIGGVLMIGGAVLGMLLAVELEGESED